MACKDVRTARKAVIDHVGFVGVDCIEQRSLTKVRGRQCAAKAHRALQRDIGADTAISRHRMNGVIQKHGETGTAVRIVSALIVTARAWPRPWAG